VWLLIRSQKLQPSFLAVDIKRAMHVQRSLVRVGPSQTLGSLCHEGARDLLLGCNGGVVVLIAQCFLCII